MIKDDYPVFLALFTTLTLYFPQHKIDISVVAEGYFDVLRRRELAYVEALFVKLRHVCKFFPTIAEMLDIANEWKRRDYECATCHTVHGAHVFHHVAHDEEGPYCMDCDVALPCPAALPAPAPVKQIVSPPLSADEQAAFRDLLDRLPNMVGTHAPDNAPSAPALPKSLEKREMTQEEREARRALLKHQAAILSGKKEHQP